MSDGELKWGIVGTGSVARLFAQAVSTLPEMALHAVCSKSPMNAKNFASTFHIPNTYSTYSELLDDPNIDIVYIATPNSLHYEQCLEAINARKHILCEKPLTMSAQKAREIFDASRHHQLFCMEAMWMKCVPIVQEVLQQVKTGIIGSVCMVSASLGNQMVAGDEHRLFNPHLGGGVLMDLGVYPLSLIHSLLGYPQDVQGVVSCGKTGVDEQASAVLGYHSGALASFSCSFKTKLSNDCVITGTKGSIRIHDPIYRPHKYTLSYHRPIDLTEISLPQQLPWVKRHPMFSKISFHLKNSVLDSIFNKSKDFTDAYVGNGYQYEALEAYRCIREGKLESEMHSHSDTIGVIEIINQIQERQQPTFTLARSGS